MASLIQEKYITVFYSICIQLRGRIQPNIGFNLTARFGGVYANTRSAITLPKVNQYVWNLKNSEYIVGAGLADFGHDSRSGNSWRARRNFVFFLSGKQHKISLISHRPNFTKFEHNTSIGVVMTIMEQNFENFTVRSGFSKNAKISSHFLTSCNFSLPYLCNDHTVTEIHYQNK